MKITHKNSLGEEYIGKEMGKPDDEWERNEENEIEYIELKTEEFCGVMTWNRVGGMDQ